MDDIQITNSFQNTSTTTGEKTSKHKFIRHSTWDTLEFQSKAFTKISWSIHIDIKDRFFLGGMVQPQASMGSVAVGPQYPPPLNNKKYYLLTGLFIDYKLSRRVF